MHRGKDWVAPIDGLRAVAALLVLASHTSAVPIPLGTAGVWLFFVLSVCPGTI
jgi:peptidoglycan/LPS O-acetylase OafA/YrhL